MGFVRLLNRFPAQQPFELIDELLTFVGVQLTVDAGLITHYQHRRQTISEHQQRITEYLHHTPFGETEAKRLEAFVFEESCRLEQTAALESRVQEFLKEQKILQPADSTVARIIGEQRKLAREHSALNLRRLARATTSGFGRATRGPLVLSPRSPSRLSSAAGVAGRAQPFVVVMLSFLFPPCSLITVTQGVSVMLAQRGMLNCPATGPQAAHGE